MSASSTATGGALACRGLRYLAVALLLGIGAIHLHDYFADYYRVIPVIGDLFAANFALAIVLAITLAAPIERIPRLGPGLHILTVLGAIAFSLGVIIGLEISEFSTLFGFHEHGYWFAVALSLAFEAATILALAGYLALSGMPRAPGRHAPTAPA